MSSVVQFPPEEVKKQWAEQDKRDQELRAVHKTNCCDALEDIAAAMRYPDISLRYLEAAIAKLTVAKDCAKALDR